MTDSDRVTFISALLSDYLESFHMTPPAGPLRAMGELTRGILLTRSVQMTNAARVEATTPSRLAHLVKRLGHHLSNPRWNHQPWARELLRAQAQAIQEDDLIPIDATELAKPYARVMQYQTIVRDASAPGDPLVTGYWCWGAYHWQIRAETLTSLMLHPYSPAQPGFESENRCWVQCLHALRQVTDGRGIWLHDRGGDRPEILSAFLRLQPRWIIRLREDRALIGPDGTVRPAGVWADWALAHRPERGRAVTLLVRLPPQDVSQPSCPPPLWLVVPTYTYGNDQRWVLLTCGLIDRHVGPRQVRHCYGGRWQGEDGKRFLGQLWHVEQFLTRSFLGLERMAWCVVAASGFVAKLQREEPELAAALEQEVVYWDKPVKLPGYRVARGLQHWAAAHGLAVVWN